MRIGIDARELCGRATGAGRYLGGLLREWAADDGARHHEFVLYAPEPVRLSLDAARFPTRIVPGPAGIWWEQVRLPAMAAHDRLDAFFAPAYTAPLRLRVPLIVAIHDLSFVAHPEWFRFREGVRRRTFARQAAKRAQAVVTISEFSRRELTEHFGVPAPRVHVIPPGVTAPGSGRDLPQAVSSGHHTAPRILYVGSIFNRRHVPDLVRAFARLARTHPDAVLDLAGDNRSYPYEDLDQLIARDNLAGRVRWHQFVSDEELTELYAGARAFAFLSEYEGLGLTPLEALAAGVPPVLLDTAVARESCGDAALYVAKADVRGTADALERALFDVATRARLLAAAPAALAKYSWPRAARETLAVIERSG